jgi:dienelactone hydrolase
VCLVLAASTPTQQQLLAPNSHPALINHEPPSLVQTELAFQAYLRDAQAFYLQLAAKLQQRYGDAGFSLGACMHAWLAAAAAAAAAACCDALLPG